MTRAQFTSDFDEILLMQNPKGGRPMQIGNRTFLRKETDMDITNIKEETEIRYHLGYCTCSRAIKIGHKRAEILVEMLQRKGIKPSKERKSLRVILLRLLLSGMSVDKLESSAL